MAFIDERGRLFNRINVFDAAVAAGLVAIVALSFAGYRLLKVPPPPRVTDVSPKTVTAAPSIRLAVKGENLLPYMHVYLRRAGDPTAVMHDSTRWTKMDSYTPANMARTAFRLESPRLAEVETLDLLEPGTYDMVFHDDLKVVGVAQAAFQVVPAPKIKVESKERESTLLVSGAFVGMNEADAGRVRAGSKIPTGTEDPPGEVVSAGTPVRDVVKIEIGTGPIEAPVLNRWRVPADLRLRCATVQSKCYFMDMVVFVGDTLKLQVDGVIRNFLIEKVSPATTRSGEGRQR